MGMMLSNVANTTEELNRNSEQQWKPYESRNSRCHCSHGLLYALCEGESGKNCL